MRRESLVKLEVISPGMLNAVVFWFDLHLDDVETLTNGEFVLLSYFLPYFLPCSSRIRHDYFPSLCVPTHRVIHYTQNPRFPSIVFNSK